MILRREYSFPNSLVCLVNYLKFANEEVSSGLCLKSENVFMTEFILVSYSSINDCLSCSEKFRNLDGGIGRKLIGYRSNTRKTHSEKLIIILKSLFQNACHTFENPVQKILL